MGVNEKKNQTTWQESRLISDILNSYGKTGTYKLCVIFDLQYHSLVNIQNGNVCFQVKMLPVRFTYWLLR